MQIEQLKIIGMTCGGCVSKVETALKTVPGVNGVSVSLMRGEASVQFKESETNLEQLKYAVEMAGFNIDKTMATSSIPKKGGCCCG